MSPKAARSWRQTSEPLGPETTQRHDALIVRNFGIKGGHPSRFAHPVAAPVGALTASGNAALVVPLRTHGSAEPAEVSPVPTVVAGNAGHALLIRNYSGGSEMAKPIEAPTGTVTVRDHHSLVTTPFLTDYHGEGNPQPVDLPHRTMDTRDRYGLVEPASIDVDDCGFRMLEPHEIGRAMAFGDDYIVLGNKRERVRQYGNAVTPPVMSLILGRAIASLAP